MRTNAPVVPILQLDIKTTFVGRIGGPCQLKASCVGALLNNQRDNGKSQSNED
jgi:hypothetical protein